MQVITMHFLARVEERLKVQELTRALYQEIRPCSFKGLNVGPLFSFRIFLVRKKIRIQAKSGQHKVFLAKLVLIRYLFTGCQNKNQQCLD